MRSAFRWSNVMLLPLLAMGCDPAKVEEQQAMEAQAKADSDSAVALIEAQMDSAAAAIAAAAASDSTTMQLDSGVWNIEEPGVAPSDDDENSGEELVYEKWKHVSDDTVAIDRRHFDEAAIA